MQILYFIILSLAVLASLMDWRSRNIRMKTVVYIVLGIVLVVYAGFRDGDYILDYKVYKWMYEDEIYLAEPTFIFISLLTRHFLGGNVLWLFVIYALVGVWVKFIAIKRLSNLFLFSLLIYIADFFILQEMTQMRAAVATGFMLLAIPSIYERNIRRFALFFILAFLFHISALVMVGVWFLKPGRINKNFWFVAVVAGYVLAFLKIDMISLVAYIPLNAVQEKYMMYKSQQEAGGFSANVFSLLFLGKLFLTLLLLWKSELLIAYNKYAYLLLKIMLVSLISLLLFSQNLAAGLRISEFLGIVSIALFPMIYYIIRPHWCGWTAIILIAAGLVSVRIFSMQLISSVPL